MTTRLTRALPAALAAVLVALLAASSWLWYDGRVPDRSAAASTTGRTAASTFFTLDADDVDATVDAMLELSTGEFRTDYEAQRDRLVEEVESKGLKVSADVPDDGTALEFLDGDRAQVLVAVDATTTLPDGSTETNNYRVRVRLSWVDDADAWLVSGLEQVG